MADPEEPKPPEIEAPAEAATPEKSPTEAPPAEKAREKSPTEAPRGEEAPKAPPPDAVAVPVETAAEPAGSEPEAPAEAAAEPEPPQRPRNGPEAAILVDRSRLRRQTRRDFFLFGAGAAAAAAGLWWLLPEDTRDRVLSEEKRAWLDSLEARLGASPQRRENLLNRALTFDDDVAEALYSRDRRVREYRKSDVTPLRNNYDGQTPSPEYIPGWRLELDGLASGRVETFAIGDLLSRFPLAEQVTRLCCVEGWSAVSWWGGLRFGDFLRTFPPRAGARWARLDSSVNLDSDGNPDPYYVSIDLETARHPQTLLATHQNGRPLSVEHGAPLRLLVPTKLGLKNIKAVTKITYSSLEPPDYWNERGYSKYDGL